MNNEQFWQGKFGDDYTARNVNLVNNNYQMFYDIFCGDYYPIKNYNINSIIEFGAGSGMNIQALQRIFPDADYTAVEINSKAIEELQNLNLFEILNQSIIDFKWSLTYNLVLTKGLLIHIHPDDIQKAYEVIYNASNKYILLCEYYAPNRIMIPYRGENDKLWKFDFIFPMIEKGCKILDYGFISKYDQYPQDDITWFLMEK